MLFASGSEFLLVGLFLIAQLIVRYTFGSKVNKYILLAGSVSILSTIVTLPTLAIHFLGTVVILTAGRYISKSTTTKQKGIAALSILSLILFFCIRSYPKAFGIESFQLTTSPDSIIQRLGLSYIIFRHIQFIVDSVKGKIKNYALIDYINFILFFPNFLAGPIDTYNNFKRWSDRKEGLFKSSLILPGVGRITLGYVKKFILVPLIYTNATDYTVLMETMSPEGAISLSLFYYSIYIYLDFSGYSDIAIGSGYIIGIRTPENFKTPYFTTNIADFWKRWHITFSNFLRDLIFKPIVKGISKSRIKLPRLSVSVIGYILTFFICGIWHGDTVNFVYWGLWHGVGLSVYKLWSSSGIHNRLHLFYANNRLKWFADISGFTITFSFVTFGWIFFHYSGENLTNVFKLLIG